MWTHPPDHWRSARSASPSEQNRHVRRLQLVPRGALDAIDERAAKDGQSADAVVREALSNDLDQRLKCPSPGTRSSPVTVPVNGGGRLLRTSRHLRWRAIRGTIRLGSVAPVYVATVLDAQHDDFVSLLVDPVEDSIGPSACGTDTGELATKGLAHSMGVVDEGPGEELDDCRSHGLG